MPLLQVPGMKMRNLLFGVILGILAVVNSSPVYTVTQISGKAEDDVIREAVTDGFLVERSFLPSLATESPKRNTTVQASQHLSSGSTVSDTMEGITEKTPLLAATTMSVSHAQSSTTLMTPGGDSSSDLFTVQSPQSSLTSALAPNEAQSSATPDHISASQTTDPAVSNFDFLSTQSVFSGSGDGEMLGQHSTTTSSITSISNKETSSAPSASTAAVPAMFEGEGSGGGSDGGSGDGSGSGMTRMLPTAIERNPQMTKKIVQAPEVAHNTAAPVITPAPFTNGHSTPGWMIILGFVVGVAALVMLFVAIATRDKWNGPRQTSQHETKANTANQQRELEMETFLLKDNPKENGKTGEYTVIPLDELPEKYSSH